MRLRADCHVMLRRGSRAIDAAHAVRGSWLSPVIRVQAQAPRFAPSPFFPSGEVSGRPFEVTHVF
jgi:hypothetical protein